MPFDDEKICDLISVDNIANTTHDINKDMVILNAKNAGKFVCEHCNFTCSKASNYKTHLSTRKHKMTIMNLSKDVSASESSPSTPNTCVNCNKQYIHASGLSRHKKNCVPNQSTQISSETIIHEQYNKIIHLLTEINNTSKSETNEYADVNDNDNDNEIYPNENIKLSAIQVSRLINDNNIRNKMMFELIKSNTQLQAQMVEICKSGQMATSNYLVGNSPQITNNSNNSNSNNITMIHDNSINTNSNNNTFNMNMFLNEKCKDAMNMKDFVNSIQLNMTDMENMNRLGYVEGMSNIFINNLQKTDLYKRPVHCSDVKRETLYVKENNQWERDGPDHVKMTNAVLAVEHKNVVLVNEWAKANPRCLNSNTRENEKYIKMAKSVTDGEKEGNIDKVIRKVAKSVAIEKGGASIENS